MEVEVQIKGDGSVGIDFMVDSPTGRTSVYNAAAADVGGKVRIRYDSLSLDGKSLTAKEALVDAAANLPKAPPVTTLKKGDRVRVI